jgi:hypothetical protein
MLKKKKTPNKSTVWGRGGVEVERCARITILIHRRISEREIRG